MPDLDQAPRAPAILETLALRGRRRIPAELWDAAREARGLDDAARAEAERILARARVEAEEARSAAERRGREEGLAAVSELHVAGLVARDRMLDAARRELVELAFAVAERVIGDVVRRHPDVVLETAGRALDACRGRQEVAIRAHPADVPELRGAEARLREAARGAPRIRIVEDGALLRGGVIVETELGRVDGSIGAQLAALRRAVGGAEGEGA